MPETGNIFDGGNLSEIFNPQATPTEPVVEPATDPAASAEPVAPSEPAAPASEPPAALPTFEDMLSERSEGKFKSWDDITSLLSPKEPEFANENSKKVFELLKAGKIDEVVDTFNHQRALANLDGMNDIDAIKLAMKYKDNSLSDSDIQAEINDMFDISEPEKPAEDDYLTDEEYQKALKSYNKDHAAYEKSKRGLERNIKAQAKASREYLSDLRSEIVLPDLPAPAVPAQKELTPQEKADQDAFIAKIQESFEFAKENLKTHNFKYSDGGVEFETGYDITDDDKNNMLERLAQEEFTTILTKRYVKGDGTLDAMKLMEELHFLENRDAIRKNDIRQAYAKAKESVVKDVKNIDLTPGGSGQQVTESEAERYVKFAESVFRS